MRLRQDIEQGMLYGLSCAEEEAAAAAAQQQAETALASAKQQSQVLEQQLAEAEQAGRVIEGEAVRLRARADADQQILQLYAGGCLGESNPLF